MGDANQLMLVAERSHLCANRMRDLAADVRVDLIEDEKRNRIVRSERGLYREHQA